MRGQYVLTGAVSSFLQRPDHRGPHHSRQHGWVAPAGGRYLTSVPVAAGAVYLQTGGKLGPHDFVMQCGSGQSDDQSRKVEWNVVGSYARLTMTVTPSGQVDPETLTQVEVLADDIQVDNNPALVLGRPTRLDAPISGAHQVALRLTCQSPFVHVTFSGALLTG